ncbi:MAG: hypothetical protein PHE36_11815 [Novosphingobium sp.]|nr:hypothetical protein [Novosphingobium sp.]
MLRRLFLALLTLCLALPAAAMPLEQPAALSAGAPAAVASMAMDNGGPCHPQGGKAALGMSHDCIGCIAPYQAAPRLAEPFAVRGAIPRPLDTIRLPAFRAGPETPPPRA